MPRIRVLAIDLIDTLVDRGYSSFIPEAIAILENRGLRITSEAFFKNFRKRYLEYSLGNYPNDEEFFAAVLAPFAIETSFELVSEMRTAIDSAVRPFAESTPFLADASSQFKLILATNYVQDWVDTILDTQGWNQYFEHVVVSSTCRFRKPASGFFGTVAAACSAVPPNEVMMIGDSSIHDGYGAVAAGFHAVLVKRRVTQEVKKGEEDNWSRQLPSISSFSDLPGLIHHLG